MCMSLGEPLCSLFWFLAVSLLLCLFLLEVNGSSAVCLRYLLVPSPVTHFKGLLLFALVCWLVVVDAVVATAAATVASVALDALVALAFALCHNKDDV